MEDDDDDEFGDLYTDVLRPISFQVSATPSSSAVAPPPPQVAFTSAATAAAAEPSSDPALSSSSSDGDGDGKGRFLFGSSGSVPAASIPSQTLASPAAAAKDAVGEDDDEGGGWMHDRDPLVAEAAENWGGDQDEVVSFRPADLDVAGSPGESKPKVLEEDNEEEIKVPGLSDAGARISGVGRIQASEEVQDFVFGAATGEDPDELDRASAIPGISTGPLSLGTFPGMSGGDVKPEQSEDWDSDSEDDLQIVLNDNNHGLLGAERNNTNEAEDDDDGEEDLIIVTDEDQHHHLPITDEQQWGEDAMQPTGDGDKKETGDISKTIGAPGTVAGTRASFSGHGFHAQHHSLYKYIRPGATSVTGAPVAGAVLSAARPPLASGPIAGRGRGEWRPAGGRGIAPGQRNYHTGFGVPSWASSSGVRGFGSSLDFTLPAHKSIFDIDIESFDEKPWKYPGADVSDFFNFALDEDKWKDYCKQLEQLRLEATMQSKIRVYESGRSEQEYDPDLPPELAAAAGHHDVSADGGRGKADNGQVDFNAQGRGPTTMRPPMPTGRAIQVESGYGERLPSIDTRPPRIRDSDAIIEIVLQDSFDDPKLNDGLVEQPKKNFQNDRMNDLHGDEEDERKLVPEYSNRFTHTSRGQNRDTAVSEGDSLQSLPSGSPAEYHQASRRSPLHSDTLHGMQNGERLPRGHSRGRCDIAREHSDDLMPGQSADKCLDDNEEEKQADESDINQTSEVSAAIDDTAREPSMEQNSDEKHETIALDNEIADGMNFELHNSTRTGDGKLAYSSKKLKLSSQVEHSDVRDAGDEGDLRASNSDSSRAKSGSSKDYPRRHENSEEVLQGQTSRMGDFQRHHEGEEHRRRDDYGRGSRQDTDGSHIFPKRREDMPHLYQHREWDSNSAHPGRGRSFEKAESELIPQRRREGSIHGRRIKAEDMRGETSDETMARHRGKLRSVDRNNRDGDLHSKKQSEDRDWRGHGREGSSRQREKDNYLMNRRETLDDPLIKRKRDEEHLRDESSKMKNQEDSSQRKRERGDITDHRKRDESTRMREKTEDHYSAKHRDDSWRYKERDDKERLKQSRESAISHREREQRQGVLKTTREGKPLGGDVRYNEELTAISSDKDYQDKDRRMPSDNIRRGERTREDTLPERKGRGNALSHEKQSNTDERSSRQERINLYDDRPPSASNNQQLYKERHRENMKKNKDTGVGEQSSQMLGKRKHEDHGSRRNEKAGMKGLNKSENNNISSATSSKKDGRQVHQHHDVHQANTSLRKQGEEDPTSDDENQQNSRRGRSKLERWTSNKERDYGVIDSKQKLPMPSRPMDVDANDIDVVHTAELPNNETNDNAVDVDAKVVDSGHPVEKTEDDRDPHLDTVAKLKRRSERFKLPMPSDKEITSNRKQDNELQTSQGEAVVTDTEVRPERPARKRRWTGS